MSTAEVEPASRLRWGIYAILMSIGVGGMAGRILAVNAVDKIGMEKVLRDSMKREDWRQQRPFLSGNDRSRWATIRALVEHGTYEIDAIVSQPGWDTIDMVKHDDQGNPASEPDKGHLYSSKPPLLATILAGEYWVIHKLTGYTLGTHPYAIGRGMLFTFNVLPMLVMFVCIARMAERYGRNDWARVFVVASAVFCTFLTTFAVVLNNHLPAAVSVAIALDAGTLIIVDGRREWRLFIVAGFFAAFAAANELPALSFAAALGALVFWKAPRQTLIASVPAALVVAAAFFGTNYAAHGTFKPAYSERHEESGWYIYQYKRGDRVIDSYWMDIKKRSPVDQGEPDPGLYAFHALIGHHGIFSLTPIWVLSAIGLVAMAARAGTMRLVALAILAVSLVCIAFYLTRSVEDRNYGGMTSGLRWAFWLAPMWLVGMLPALEYAASRRGLQAVCLVFLAFSTLSVS
jgi:hypothetical protein